MHMNKVPTKCALPERREESKQWPQVLAVFSAALLSVGGGLLSSWPSPSLPKLLSEDLGFIVTEKQTSFMVMLEPLGYLIGSPITGFLLNRIGRKYTLLALALPQIASHLLIATSNNVIMIYIARVISGASNGAAFTCIPAYMGEIVEPKVRGSLGAINALGIAMGALIMVAYGSYVSIRAAACIALLVPTFFILTFVWMPESPYYLIMKGQTEDARKSLKYLRNMNNVDEELMKITSAVQRQMSEPGSFTDIFTINSNLKAFLIVIGLKTFQQLSGMSTVNFYNQLIFEQAAAGALSPAESTIIISGIRVIAVAIGLQLVDRFGRKIFFISTITGSSVTIILLGLYFNFLSKGIDMTSIAWFPLLSMTMYFIFTSGLLIIPSLMAAELLSVRIKSAALSLSNVYLGLCISGTSALFQWLVRDHGMDTPFFVFGLCSLVGALFCFLFVPETKGKTLEEIQHILKRPSFRRSRKVVTLA